MMKPVRGELMVVDSGPAFAEAGAMLFAQAAAARGPKFVAGLAGGSTPKAIYELLSAAPFRTQIDWSELDFVLGDERFVAPDDANSNVHMIRRALFDRLDGSSAKLHPVPYDGMTIDAAARSYESVLKSLYGADVIDPARPFFDIVFLGMGDDGHTASLLPGQPELLDERRLWVLPVTKGRPEARVTLTYPVLKSAKLVVFVVSGTGKCDMLDQVLSGVETEVPAARLHSQGRLVWLVDRDAAGRWA
jgi:6-phosphogluconolactonase